MQDTQTIYVVMCNSWNGTDSVESVSMIYNTKQAADAFVRKVMSGTRGPYSSEYYVEEHEMIVDQVN